MATDALKKVQEKLFRSSTTDNATNSSDTNNDTNTNNASSAEPRPADTKLKIQIPQISAPAPPLQVVSKPVVSQLQTLDQRSYRARLAEKLGAEYKGVEKYRLEQDGRRDRYWKRIGPYVSDRQWATVREDYSADGNAWAHFPHDHARSRTYRWGEDGIAGICDNHQRFCLGLSLWNEKDDILKERLFGVTGPQGNHGEDVKELYYYLDSTPTHSYMKFLYKYPQSKYPYEELVKENGRRDRNTDEYELLDTGIFEDDRYWDVFVEYAKDEDQPESLCMRITAYNRGPEPATLHIIPQLWFRNYWSWPARTPEMPTLTGDKTDTDINYISLKHPGLAHMNRRPPTKEERKENTSVNLNLYCLPSPPPVGPNGEFENEDESDVVEPELLFTENNTNFRRLYGGQNMTPYVKDAFHDHIVPSHRPPTKEGDEYPGFSYSAIHSRTRSTGGDDGDTTPEEGPRTPFPAGPSYVNPDQMGTKSAAHYVFRDVPANGGCAVVRLRLTPNGPATADPAVEDEAVFDNIVEERRVEADEFYDSLVFGPISDDLRQIMRQALSGMLWTKQFYKFIQKEWIEGDPAQPPPPPERKFIRNTDWANLHMEDILSMPDKWEYPFFAAWDTAFHCIPLAIVDPAYAKSQLTLLTREWYMRPDGQIPAYEWNFGDVNPPVHAWSAFRVYKMERKLYGREDVRFLETMFQKLMVNFTWWVNRKDRDGQNVFEGGFLGLDNIGVFNRSERLPTGGSLRQADGTSWMAFYALSMLSIALELAKFNDVYIGMATKFFEHFLYIADAMTYKTQNGEDSLWNEEEGFYFDAIKFDNGHTMQLPVRSLVGLTPLFATLVIEPAMLKRFPEFKKRVEWFLNDRPDIRERNIANIKVSGRGERRLLALASKERLQRILQKMLDESEFFSEHGIRSLSKKHKHQPWGMEVHGQRYEVGYWPGDSHSPMFGGNSNWRGPIWLPMNFLIIEGLQRFYQYYGDDFQIECPTGSGDYMNLAGVAQEIQHRIIHIFGRDMQGRRANNGGDERLNNDPHFRDYVHFYEFFHGDTGKGLGASHQTGWSGLVAFHILQSGVSCRLPKTPKTPRSVAHHYFDEHLEPQSEYGEDAMSAFSAFSAADLNTLGDISPEAL